MRRKDIKQTLRRCAAALITALSLCAAQAKAPVTPDSATTAAAADSAVAAAARADSAAAVADSIARAIGEAEAFTDSIARSIEATIAEGDSMAAADARAIMPLPDSIGSPKTRKKRDWATWRPNPQRAMWLALVIPGAGQIYNRKYWKLPIIYGGFMGCLYALNWNNMMYKDYSQAYLDIMDSDPTTQSYNQFLHLGQRIDSSNEERYKEIFKSRRDRYRRWRDLSFFCMIGVYALSVIDAYVDAELSEFDISKDLSLKVEPAVINNNASRKVLEASSFGIQCQLRF